MTALAAKQESMAVERIGGTFKLDRVIASGELKAKERGHAVMVMRSEIARYIERQGE